ncbi:MAG: ankyrin repeat domain-containing protein [Candidatus Dependentiae bacterium]|nr:ankyrin repeat domain-containing protein [Candidatus Dependentiae bacterium]
MKKTQGILGFLAGTLFFYGYIEAMGGGEKEEVGEQRQEIQNLVNQHGLNGALRYVSREGDIEKVRMLIADKADVSCPNRHKITALMNASLAGHMPVVTELISRGASIHSRDNKGYCAVNLAALGGHEEPLNFLIGKNADIESLTDGGMSPLQSATLEGHSLAAQRLIAAGANVNSRHHRDPGSNSCSHDYQCSILWNALLYNQLEIAQQLISAGALIDAEALLEYPDKFEPLIEEYFAQQQEALEQALFDDRCDGEKNNIGSILPSHGRHKQGLSEIFMHYSRDFLNNPRELVSVLNEYQADKRTVFLQNLNINRAPLSSLRSFRSSSDKKRKKPEDRNDDDIDSEDEEKKD